jgi:hypothetical protein
MWDLLITIGNIIIIPALLTTAFDRRAYIPRLASGVSIIGLIAVIAGLIGTGLVLSPIVVGVISALWVYIFLFRHRPGVPHSTVVVPELGITVHTESEETTA